MVLPFKINEDEDKDNRTSCSEYYTPTVEIKDFNVLIDDKVFLVVPRKNKEETYEKIIEMSKNNDCKSSKLLDRLLFKSL